MSNICFKQLSFRNFLSFSNLKTTLNLDDVGTTLIVGENLDEGGSSGAGKTSVISALSYVLYDKVPAGISKDKLINKTNASKKVLMEVELDVEVDGVKYTISRFRGTNNGVKLVQHAPDGTSKDITPDSVAGFNGAVEELIGFSYEMFSQVILFNNNSTPFLDLKLADQRTLIEELMKITMLSRKAEALKKQISENDAQIKVSTSLHERLKANYAEELARYESDLVSTNGKFEAWLVTEAKKLDDEQQASQAALATLKTKADAWAEQEQAKRARDVEELQAKVKHWDEAESTNQATKLASLEASVTENANLLQAQQALLAEVPDVEPEQVQHLTEQLKQKADLRAIINELATKVRLNEPKVAQWQEKAEALTAQIKHLEANTCPFCKQAFASAPEKLEALKSDLVKLEADTAVLIDQVATLKSTHKDRELEASAITVSDADLAVLNQQLAAKAKLELTIATVKGKLETAQQELDYLRANPKAKQPNPFTDKLTAARIALENFDKDANPYIGQLAIAQARVDTALGAIVDEAANPFKTQLEFLAEHEPKEPDPSIAAELDKLLNLREHQKLLLKLLTDKNSFIRKGIIGKTLPFLNKRIKQYCVEQGLAHKVEFKSDMTCSIMYRGEELDHGNLSNGEKKRLNLALCLSFRDVLSYIHSRVNVLLTDEIDGGSLDEQAVLSILKLLKFKAADEGFNIFIISHRPEFDGQCTKNYVVQKQNGFSSLLER
jgi:DNA repair exonuclease SbcCD ATPase subunit